MFLDILNELMAEKGINKSILSKESGVPYTTIDGFYKKAKWVHHTIIHYNYITVSLFLQEFIKTY